jgi:two-component system, OmpR family, phosphate regulon sensor histidine kinase PhoR
VNKALASEYWRLLFVIIIIAVIGLLTGKWLPAILVPTALYIGWNLLQLNALECWLREGADKSKAPSAGGAWGEIVQHLYRRQHAAARSKKRLSRMLKQFNTTVSALPDATVILDANYDIEWVNKSALAVLGIDRKRDIGQRIDNLIRHPHFHQLLHHKSKKKRSLEMASPVNPSATLAVRLVRYGKKGQHYLLLARDITEQVEIQKTRKAFIANASHELRTPLTVISGYLAIMQSAPDLAEELQVPVRMAAEQAARMEHIIADLLELSRLESTEIADGEGTNVDMPAMLKKISSSFTIAGDHSAYVINLDLDDSLMVCAREEEVHSVAMNLIGNAVKYSPPGSVIEVRWYQNSAEEICLDVEDHGYGIAPEHLAHVTERFYRADEGRSRETGGTGLGLAIVKHIMSRHGGHLHIDSTLAEGSTFRACFPRSRAVAESIQGK